MADIAFNVNRNRDSFFVERFLSANSSKTFAEINEYLKTNGEDLPVLVQFRKYIFEDDQVEPGMMAFFTGVETHRDGTLELFFTFHEDLDTVNDIMLRKSYRMPGTDRKATAKESMNWEKYYSVFVEASDRAADYILAYK